MWHWASYKFVSVKINILRQRLSICLDALHRRGTYRRLLTFVIRLLSWKEPTRTCTHNFVHVLVIRQCTRTPYATQRIKHQVKCAVVCSSSVEAAVWRSIPSETESNARGYMPCSSEQQWTTSVVVANFAPDLEAITVVASCITLCLFLIMESPQQAYAGDWDSDYSAWHMWSEML